MRRHSNIDHVGRTDGVLDHGKAHERVAQATL